MTRPMPRATEKRTIATTQSLVRDLSWFSIVLSSLVGAPSILALAEMTFDWRLIEAFRWIVDGYHRLTSVLDRIATPIVAAASALSRTVLGIEFSLHPHWKPIFFLLSIVILASFRISRNSRNKNAQFAAVLALVAAFVGALIAGTISLSSATGPLSTTSAAVVIPVGLCVFVFTAVMRNQSDGPWGASQPSWRTTVPLGLFLAFGAAGCAHFALQFLAFPGWFTPGQAAVLALALSVIGVAVMAIVSANGKNSTWQLQFGFTVLGGFVTAAIVMIANILVKIADAL